MLRFLNFGGRKACLRLIWHRLCALLGVYKPYCSPDWRRVRRLVFVCKGNICRSAFAAAWVRVQGLPVDSAGLEAAPGKRANPQAIECAQRFNVELITHRSRRVADFAFEDGDLVIAFEPAHADELARLLVLHKNVQVTTLGSSSGMMQWVYVHDPYGLSAEYFDACFSRIALMLTILVKNWKADTCPV